MNDAHARGGEPRCAAVDLGSNSFHLVIARTEHGRSLVVDHVRDQVQLAAGLEPSGELEPGTFRRGLLCLARYAQRLEGIPRENIRAVGTSALRQATNRAAFLEQAQRLLGVEVEVISGVEEARLIHLGVARDITAADRPLLVVDIGGGSTEFGLSGAGLDPVYHSLALGCVTSSVEHFPEGSVTSSSWSRAREAAWNALQPLRGLIPGEFVRACGSSGTIRTAYKVLMAQDWGREWITPEGLRRIEKRLLATGRLDKLRLGGLKSARLPVFPGGLAILLEIFETLGLERMEVSRSALREGVLMELRGDAALRDRREASVEELRVRHGTDHGLMDAVARIATGLLERAEEWSFPFAEPERFLRWAALLGDIGLRVSYKDHHLHGAYLIQHSDMPGFAESDRRLLAVIVASSRRAIHPEHLDKLEEERREAVLRLVLVLRAAVTLARAPLAELPAEWRVAFGEQSLHLRLPAFFHDGHPQTVHELGLEADRLAKHDCVLSWERL